MTITHTQNGAASPSAVRYIPLSYDSSDPDSARRLILALRPDWDGPDSRLEFVRFTDGITNILLKAVNRHDGLSKEQVDTDAILLRAYGHGTDVLIDRQRETQNHELLMRHGLAPRLLARFDNGMMYCYIRGKVTQPADLREPPIYRAVARRIAQWHATVPCIGEASTPVGGPRNTTNGVYGEPSGELNASGKPSPNVWTVMQKWIRALPTSTKPEDPRMSQSRLQSELDWLVGRLSQEDGLGKDGLVFAHCDLLSGNVIIEPESPSVNGQQQNGCEDGGSHEPTVSFIDYEYATPSPAAFDLANHFSEWGGFECDYNALPTRAQRRDFVQEYIHTYNEINAKQGSGNLDEEEETEKLCAQIDLVRGLPGFYWGIWALIQATISQLDFNYTEYAKVRLAEYWAWREALDHRIDGKEMSLREKRWAQEK